MPGSGDEGTKTMATPFLVHFPCVLSFGLLFSLFLCLLCSLFWSFSLPLSLYFCSFVLSPLVFFCRPVPVFLFLLFRVYLLIWFLLCLFLFCLSSFSLSSRFPGSLFFFWPSPGMLCFWCSSCWRWRHGVRASLLVILEVDFRLRRRTIKVYRLLLLPVGGWRSTLLWLMRNGIMVASMVSDRATLVLFLLGDWSTMTMVYGLMQSLVGAPAMGRREMEQCRLRRGGTGHGEKKLWPSVMAQWPIMVLGWR